MVVEVIDLSCMQWVLFSILEKKMKIIGFGW
ncbi:MAG: hypothetical protein Hyperionvirus5_8 [Hyperionvirus sp.]|uniref:Uncharacterized protein n=1 Tax=Hyperionvirus sp. TaxID=2487770 RepID=A0A3G5A824_9VIRU|nr:MAG: hypothetical protein Hyperionvirus5_8 [Hyperionvirus sp.]